MTDSIPFLVPTQFQESIFPPVTRPKIPAQASLKNHKIGDISNAVANTQYPAKKDCK
jgi:hypothetical protein